MTHDKYDNDILKQLTRIANNLEKIEKKLPDNGHNIEYVDSDVKEPKLGKPMKETLR